MLQFIIKRILKAIPLLFLVSVICFFLIQIAPYDAVDSITTPNMSEETVANIKEQYGLDEPIYKQYFYWLNNVLHGDFGYSIVNHTSVAEELAVRIPNTIMIVLPAFILALFFSIILGLYAGSRHGKLADKMIDGFSLFGISIPPFWLALLAIYFLSFQLQIFPIAGMYTAGVDENFGDLVYHMILPVAVLTLSIMPEQIRYIRSSTIGQLNEDYVMVQSAFGESKFNIMKKHVLRNVLLPVVTLFGLSLPMLVPGAVVTETVFAWPGVGQYFVTAIKSFDYPVIMAVLLLSSTLVIIGNLLADILYMVIDPRIKGMK